MLQTSAMYNALALLSNFMPWKLRCWSQQQTFLQTTVHSTHCQLSDQNDESFFKIRQATTGRNGM
jgi:hypothetical protein